MASTLTFITFINNSCRTMHVCVEWCLPTAPNVGTHRHAATRRTHHDHRFRARRRLAATALRTG